MAVIGIVGLGLIGGSMAKAIRTYTGHTVLADNRSREALQRAMDEGVVNAPLTPDRLAECDLVIVALYPQATVAYVTEHRDRFRKGGLVMDCGGVKGIVCDPLEPVARESGFTFIGGHPMAGIEKSGYANAFPELFQGASLILTPYEGTDPAAVNAVWDLLSPLGFARLTRSTPAEHDHIIAYTSQLAHVVSCAYVGSPSAPNFEGFSAGSFKDMTRVARLNEDMWTELFLDDADYLTDELDILIGHLQEYADALKSKDAEHLRALLRDGREKKATAGGN